MCKFKFKILSGMSPSSYLNIVILSSLIIFVFWINDYNINRPVVMSIQGVAIK